MPLKSRYCVIVDNLSSVTRSGDISKYRTPLALPEGDGGLIVAPAELSSSPGARAPLSRLVTMTVPAAAAPPSALP